MANSIEEPRPNLTILAVNTPAELDRIQFHDKSDRIASSIVHNLTTNSPRVELIKYAIQPLPKASIREKLRLLSLHAKLNGPMYRTVAKAAAILLTAWLVALIAYRYIVFTLQGLHTDVVQNPQKYEMWLQTPRGLSFLTAENYYHRQATGYLAWYGLLYCVSLLPTGAYFATKITELAASFIKFYRSPHQLTRQIEEKSTIKNLTQLANNKEEDLFIDPISLTGIKVEWIQAPRFIKIGSWAFSLDTVMKRLFSKPLKDGHISHPVENRVLTALEEDNLLTSIHQLFMIDKEGIKNFWDPHYCDFRKVTLKQHFERDPRFANALPEQRPAILQDLLLEYNLSQMISSWRDLQPHQRASIKNQLEEDIHAISRLTRFLDQLPDEVLKQKININDEDSFTLQELINAEHNKLLRYSIPA